MILAVSLVTLLFASDASCQTVVTYSSKSSEELLCPITGETRTATWSDETIPVTTTLASYFRGEPEIDIINPGPKHDNFIYDVNGTSFSMFIQDVQAEVGGDYICRTVGGGNPEYEYTVVVEVIPGTISLNCFVPPDVTCPEQGVNPPSELICTCVANGVRPGTLYLDIPGAHTPQQNVSIENDGLFDLRLKATVPVTESMTEVSCSVKGYITMEQIPSKLITTTFVISPPTCSLDISFDQGCKEATLTCSCPASPTDGESPSDKGMVYSYFNGTGHIIESGTTTPAQTNDVAAGAVNTYSCRGCNGIYYGDTSYFTQSSECTISTTALPTTTITVPLSTNEPTSTKAIETTTEELNTKGADDPVSGGLTAGAIVGISLGVVAVIVVIVVVAVIMCKKGEDDSKPSVDKPDDNGAGPGKDPEIPAYGVIDKKKVKDPTPAPRSSMRDSTNSSKPKQDMEMQYADLDHGNKPPSDEVRKPKEEPTEYATVQSVIV